MSVGGIGRHSAAQLAAMEALDLQGTQAEDKTQEATDKLAQTVAEQGKAQLEGEENSSVPAQTKRLQKTQTADTEIKTKKTESVLVRLDEANEQFSGFSKNKDNDAYKLPQKSFVQLATELGTIIKADSNVEDIINHVKRSMPDADVAIVDKALEFLIHCVDNLIAKVEKEGKVDLNLNTLRLKLTQAKNVHYARNEEALKVTPKLVDIAARAVDMKDQDIISKLADSLSIDLKKEMSPAAIVKLVQKSAPDSQIATVDKELGALLDVMDRKIAHVDTTDTEKADFKVIRDNINTAKTEFAKVHAKELKEVADKSLPLKEMLMKMRDIVFNNPRTVFDIHHKFKKDPGGYKAMIKEADELFHFIGGAIKDTKRENSELGRIMDECKTIQAAKQVYVQTGKNVNVLEHRFITTDIIERGGTAHAA